MENSYQHKKTQEVVNQISDFVNTMSTSHNKDFIHEMNKEHRTLQQSFTRLCLTWLENCASDEYRHDPRNESSHFTAKELVDKWVKESGFLPSQNLPLI